MFLWNSFNKKVLINNNNKIVLITGITGFLGSHIAEKLLELNFKIFGIIRQTSTLWKIENFVSEISLFSIDEILNNKTGDFKIATIIHCAWDGASATDRDNKEIQEKNLHFLNSVLTIAKQHKVAKFISMGSQAEYGLLDDIVEENVATKPLNLYGFAKVNASTMVKEFCTKNNIKWYWLRLFSFYGPKEADNWFIPFIINNCINNTELNLTACTQQYAYLFVKDLANYIAKIVDAESANCGIYNLSSTSNYPLKFIAEKIVSLFPNYSLPINFGKVDLRTNQSTFLQGSMQKFEKEFGLINETTLDIGLNETIKYYTNHASKSI